MRGKCVIGIVMAVLFVLSSASVPTRLASAKETSKVVTIDGNQANKNPQNAFRGLGMVSANNSSRLLLDYKDEHPDRYWEIMNYLFNPETGMGLSHLKLEMGADINSSSGTEPNVKRTEKEKANVRRGAGYQLAADAMSINPDITLDMIFWSEPLWVSNAKDRYAARYQWYKETLDAAFETYGLKFDFVSANRNEKMIDAPWIIYLSKALKKEKNSPYDYSKIKIVAADEVDTWKIADLMLKDKELMNAVDVIASHYTSWSSDAVTTLSKKYGKEVWFSEGSSPMSYEQGTYKYDGTGTGISDINGMLDIASRIITMYPGGSMNLYEFQPAVASYYSGATYFPKQLITANEPWTGYYSLDAGFYMTMHFTRFSEEGWYYIDGACEGDGEKGGDGHAIINSTYNYQTIADPKTGDYSIIIANNSSEPLTYTFNVSNLAKSNAPVDVWESRGPDDATDYYRNYLKKIATITPTGSRDEVATYQLTVKPYSLVTVTTLIKEEVQYTAPTESTILELPYADDNEYVGYDKNYLFDRGYAPRYTTDEGGAFEVTTLKGNKVLQQKITTDMKSNEWGSGPKPVTNLGDDNWTNYAVSADVLFSTKTVGKSQNYIGVGARYISAYAGKSGYWLQLFDDGSYALNKDGTAVASSKKPFAGFKKSSWYQMKIKVNHNVITGYINNKKVLEYTDTERIYASGRAALYSEFNMNYFDNLKVEAIKGITPYSIRRDNTDSPLIYSGSWEQVTMSSYRNFNRTVATGSKGAVVSFEYTGEGFAVIGAGTQGTKLKVEVDGKVVEKAFVTALSKERQTTYYNYTLSSGAHKVKLTVLDGIYNVDAVEIVGTSTNKKELAD